MADRHFEDLDLDMSGDSERLVISFTPFTPLKGDDVDNQQSDDTTDTVTASHQREPTVLTVEVYQNDSDVNDDDQLSTRQPTEHDIIPEVQTDSHDTTKKRSDDISSSLTTPRPYKPSPSFLVENILPSGTDTDSSQTLPGIATMMTRSDDVAAVFQQRDSHPSHHVPLSFWDTPDYNYVLDSEYSSDSSQQPPALSWTSCDVRSGRFAQQLPLTQPAPDIASPPGGSQHQDDRITTTHAIKAPAIPQAVQKAITTRLNPLVETKPYKRHPKPPYSYAAMSIMAIENSPNMSLMYREITDAIRDMFPAFFSGEYQGWRKSVRHMLSRMECFNYDKKYDESTNRSNYYWKVDLTKVNSELFMRQPSKEDIRKTEHEFMPYLHQQLNVPPVILPEHYCDNDTTSTPSAVSRIIRDVILQHQQVDAIKKKVPDFTVFQLPNTDSTRDFGVTLPPKPANFKLNSMSTLAADPDDFLGAKTNTVLGAKTSDIQPSFPTAENVAEHSAVQDITPHVEEPIKDLGLPTYIFDSPIASPIPHDVYRDTEGLDRHCPSVGLSPSTASLSETPASYRPTELFAASLKSQPKKRTRASIGAKPNKKAKTSTGNKQPELSTTHMYNVTSGEPSSASAFQYIPPSQTTTTAPTFYPPTDPYQPFASATSSYLPPFSFDSDKSLCWPPVDSVSAPLPPAATVPSLPYGYPPEQFQWYHQTGYPYQAPASYGYPTYDNQYGVHSGYGYQQFQNEASRWYRVPYDGALNLSTKSDF